MSDQLVQKLASVSAFGASSVGGGNQLLEHPDFVPAAIVVLLVLAVGIALYVVIRDRGYRLSLKGLGSLVSGLLWLAPVIAVTVFVGWQAAPHFHRDEVPVPDDDEIAVRLNEFHRLPDSRIIPVPPTDTSGTTPVSLSVSAGRFSIRSKPMETVDQARTDVRQHAGVIIDKVFRPAEAGHVKWSLPDAVIEKSVVGESIREESFGESTKFKMQIAELSIALSDDVRGVYVQAWRRHAALRRMIVLAELLGMLVLLVAAAAAYLRLDIATQGAYRRRLKFAAVSLIAAGGLALSQFLLPLA